MLQRKDVESLTHEQLVELFLYVKELALGSIIPKAIDISIDDSVVQDIKRRVEQETRERSKNRQE